MKIYNYDANGYYTGLSYDFLGKVLPKFTTKTQPPKTIKGETIAKYIPEQDNWIVESLVSENKKEIITKEEPKKSDLKKEPIEENDISIINDLLLKNKDLKEENDFLRSRVKQVEDELLTMKKKLAFRF